jgi:hypothetical protein
MYIICIHTRARTHTHVIYTYIYTPEAASIGLFCYMGKYPLIGLFCSNRSLLLYTYIYTPEAASGGGP